MTTNSGHFALLDGDAGSAVLLTDFRGSIGSLDPTADDVAVAFAAADAATKRGEWVVLAADYELGNCFDPAMARVEA
ncbi:MAG: aminodeoxychorismate synthase, component I, partial [Propionivibrio sp.]|nr:aminodeoxychorismate synthase, component I [Propionivibrio sp.]